MSQETTEQSTATQPQAQAQEVDQAAAAAQATKQEAQETTEQTIARLTAEVAAARAEAGKSRVNAKQSAAEEATKDVLGRILGALGIQEDGSKKVTVEDVTAELTKAQTDAKTAQRNLAVYLNAGDADPARLLKFTDFLDAIHGLDPSDAEGIKKAIAATVAANPWLKATQVVDKSGAEISGGTGEKQHTLAEQIAHAEKAGDANKAIHLKNQLLLGRTQ